MSNPATIICHRDASTGLIIYEWRGPITGVVAISLEFLEESPDLLKNLPWELEEISRSETVLRTAYYKRKAAV